MNTEHEANNKMRMIFAEKEIENGTMKKILLFLPNDDIEYFKNILYLFLQGTQNDIVEICYLPARRSGCIISKIFQDARNAKPVTEPSCYEKWKYWHAMKDMKEYSLKAYECFKEHKSLHISHMECKALLDDILYLQKKIAEAKENNTFITQD